MHERHPPHLLSELGAHLERFVGPDCEALVFTGEKGGPFRPHVLQKAWLGAKAKAGLPFLHLHDLRQAGNTWAAAAGFSTKELMVRMGHASSAAALRYQHATADRDGALDEALSALAEPARVIAIARDVPRGREKRRDKRVSGVRRGRLKALLS